MMENVFHLKTLKSGLRCVSIAVLAILIWGCESTPKKGQGNQGESAVMSLTSANMQKYQSAMSSLANKKPEAAEQVLQQLVLVRPDIAEVWINLALSQYQQKHFDHAKMSIENLNEQMGGLAESYNLLGLIAVEQGEFSKAENFYKKAIEMKPKYSNALFNMALLQDVYFQRISLAVKYYERYSELMPQDKDTLNWTNGLKMSLEQ